MPCFSVRIPSSWFPSKLDWLLSCKIVWLRPSKQIHAPLYSIKVRRQRRLIVIKYGITYVLVIAIFAALIALRKLFVLCMRPLLTYFVSAGVPRRASFQMQYLQFNMRTFFIIIIVYVVYTLVWPFLTSLDNVFAVFQSSIPFLYHHCWTSNVKQCTGLRHDYVYALECHSFASIIISHISYILSCYCNL